MIRTAIRGVGELLITLGLVVLLFAAYEVYGKAFEVNAEKERLGNALNEQWAAAQPNPGKPAVDKPVRGKAMAKMYIPRLGLDWAVVEGVEPADIKKAPGHYPKSQLPGQLGNFAVAGHRMGAVFWNLDKMQDGDPIVVETRTSWHVYRVVKSHIIRPNQVEVVAPNPDNPGAAPNRKLLTITTCNPKWDNYERLVVHAELRREQPRTSGKPAELGGL
jgi:sortase A